MRSSRMDISNDPLVSICIPAYNAERTIEDTLTSIINQSYKNLEIIISENGSTDSTLDIIKKFNDYRIKLYCYEHTVSAEQNFSRCIDLANGVYIAIFHADDVYTPNMVAEQVNALNVDSSIGAVFTMAYCIDINGKVIGDYVLPCELKGKQIFSFNDIFKSILKNHNFLLCPSAMVRGRIYKDMGTFNINKFGTSSDLDMWLRVLNKGPISIIDKKLMCYRISSNQGSAKYNKLRIDEGDFFKVVDFHLECMNYSTRMIFENYIHFYDFQRANDNIQRAVNLVLRDQPKDAKALLKKTYHRNLISTAMADYKNPTKIAILMFGLFLLFSLYVGFGYTFCELYGIYRSRKSHGTI